MSAPSTHKLRRFVAGLIAAVTAAAGLIVTIPTVASVPVASAADGTASFTWEMPPRFGADSNNDHLIDMIDDATEAPLAHPTGWPVDFNACEPDGTSRPNATYSWTFDGAPPTTPSTECKTSHTYAAVDTAYSVTLTVVDSAGTTSTTQTILPRDYVIVIMGDSASSGEGNPDWLDADWTRGGTNVVFAPKWNNDQCHRSALSGQAQAALRLEQRDPHSSVTFVHVGCSGARITRGVLAPYQGIHNPAHPRLDCDDPNFANPYKPGQSFYIKFPDSALDAPNPQGQGCLPSQIDQVKAILGTRAIDAVSIVAGINDIFFSKPIMACLVEDDCTTAHSTMLLDPVGRLQTTAEFIAPRFAQLQDRYKALFSTVMSEFTFRDADPALGIAAGHVYLAEYPNSGQNPDGTPCNSNELSLVAKAPQWARDSLSYFLQSLATSPNAGTFAANEWAWATANILEPLNAAGQTAVSEANTQWPGRFSVVTGSTHAFDTHGYCAPDTWMQSVGTSLLYQRDPEGSFHPNRAGHFFGYALPLETALAGQLGVTAPALPPTVGGDIETLEAINQSWAPLMQVMGRTNIIEELDRIFPIQPGLPSKKGTDWSGIISTVFTGIATHVGKTVAARGLSDLDVLMDDIDGINGPDNDGQIGDVVINVSGEISPHTMTDKYALDIHISAHGPAASLNWSMAGLSLSGSGSDIDLDTTLHFIIEPGRNDGFRAYLPVADNTGFTVRLTAQQELPASAATTAQLGPIDLVAHGPQGGNAIDIDTGLTMSLVDPDGDGKVTVDELTAASFSALFDITCATGSHVDVDVALDGGLPGMTGNIARLQLHDTNVCDGLDAPTITFAQPNFEGLINMGTTEVLDLAVALANTLERLQAAGNLPVPFTDQQIRDALDLVSKLRAIAADPQAAAKTSLQTLVTKIETELGLAPGSMNLRFDPATSRFLFDLVIAPSAPSTTLPVDLGLLADAGLLNAGSTASVSVSASAAIALHLAFDVTPDPAGTATENLRSVSDRLLISTDSGATFDATAAIQADATAKVGLVPVEVTIDNGSGGAQQLLVKRDPSQPLASVGISGPGSWVSLADLLSGLPARASVDASLNAALNPTTVTARAVLGTTELARGHVTVSWNDLSRLSGADGPHVTADADYSAAIARFAEAANDPIELIGLILGGVRDSADAAVELARTNEQLARSLPLIGKGYDDVVAGFAGIGAAADTLARLHADLTLPQIEQALEAALAEAIGVAPSVVADKISLGLDRSAPRTALVLHIDLCQASAASAACSAVRPVQGNFSFDANGLGFVGTSGQAALALDYLARLRIDLALELPMVNLPDATHAKPYIADGEAPAAVYVLGSTSVDIRLGASANGSLSAYVGPFAASLGISGTKGGQPFSDPATVEAKVSYRVASGGPASERLTPSQWLAKVQANLAANGVTQPVETTCTPTSNQGCASLPVYFKTAAGDVTAADGTKWVKLGTGPVTFSAVNLLDPSTFSADVPPSVLTDLQNQAFSVTSLITAIRYVLDQAKISLDGEKIGQELPIVGKVYAAGSSLIADIDALAAKLQQLAATIESQTSAGNVRNQLRNWLFTNLGPSSSLKLILDRNGDNTVTAADIDVTVMCGAAACADVASLLDITDVKLVLSIGKTASAAQPPIDFGVKGLQIKSEGTASASIGWHLDLALGVDDGGIYVDPAGASNRPELGLSVDASLPALFDATIAGLPIAITDSHPGQDVDIELGVDVLGAADQRLRLPELLGRGDNTSDRNALAFTIKGCADLDVGFEVAVPGVATPDALPAILGDIAFHADWNGCPGTPGAGRDLRDGLSPNASFDMRNLRLDVGKLASRWIGKVANEIQRVTGPIQPVIDKIQQPIPVVSDLAALAGKQSITWLQAWAAGQRASGNDVTAVETIIRVLNFVNTVGSASVPEVAIPIADDISIDLSQAQSVHADPDEAFDKLIAGTPVVKDVMTELTNAGWDIKSSIDAVADESKGAEFSFPALEKPSLLLQMLFGKDVDLAVFDAGTLRAENGFDVFYGLPFAKVGIRGSASIEGHLALSYDTAGIRRVVATKPLKWSSLGALVHGFGINDLDSEGNDVPEIQLDTELALYAYAGVPGANLTAEGGVEGHLQADLIDPDGDGKVRYDEIKARISNPRCLFDTSGKIDVFARLKGELGPFSGTKDIVPPFVLFEFTSIESWCRQMESSGGGTTPIPQPVLAEVRPTDFRELNINVGTRAAQRNLGGDGDETVTITDLGDGRVTVSMFGVTQEYGSTTNKITNVRAFPLNGNDKIYVNGPTGPGDSSLVYVIQGGPGNDVIQTGNANDQVQGDAGNDVLIGRAGDDILSGGDGNDTIDGGAGSDTLHGDLAGSAGAGDDTIDGGDGPDRIYPMSGRDTVTGGPGDDVIDGRATLTTGLAGGPDHLDGGEGNDAIFGSTSNDIIIGGLNSTASVGIHDTLWGEDGDDCILADNGTAAFVTVDGVETCQIVTFDDTINEKDSLLGGKGSDTMFGGGGDDRLDGDDDINSDTGDDFADGGTGNDTMLGAGGNDTLIGGPGNDDMSGEDGNDRLSGGDGADDMNGGNHDDEVLGGAGNDVANGGNGSDVVIGDDGDDTLDGMISSLNTTSTTDGDDVVDGGDGNDIALGGPGNDRVSGGAGDDILTAETGDDILIGGAGTDVLDGHAGNDLLRGGAGDDRLTGKAGNDRLEGGDGNDVLGGDAVRFGVLTPPTFPSGAQRISPLWDLNYGAADTYDGGSGDDFIYDVVLDPPSDAPRAGLTVTITDPADHGTSTGTVGSYLYSATAGYQGDDQIGFQLKSAGVVVATGTMIISNGQNAAPIAGDDTAVTDPGQPVLGNVLVNDTDPNADVLTVTPATGTTASGSYTIAAGGGFTYTPSMTFTGGVDSFSYTVVDPDGASDTATVTITIRAERIPPSVSCEQPTAWSADEWTVHCAASDTGSGLADPAQASFDLVSVVGVGNEGSYVIDPSSVCDIAGNCTDLAPFDVKVDRRGPSITSANDGQAYQQFATVSRDVSCADAGSGLVAPCPTGDVLDTSTPGDHNFPVTAIDAVGNTTVALFTYTVVAAPNAAPTAVADSVDTEQAKPVSGNVLTNDSDPEGDALTVLTSTETGVGGQFVMAADGTFTYTPTLLFTGVETYSYTVSDGHGNAVQSTVTITVHADVVTPDVSCNVPTGWSATEVTVTCTATDAGTGFGGSGQTTFDLVTALGAGQEGPVALDPPSVCDDAGNCTDLLPFTVLVDRKAPQVASSNDGATYTSTQAGLTKQITCSDGGSGLVEPACPQDGEPLDMTVGIHSFTVVVDDAVGNSASKTVTYTVTTPAGITVSVEDLSTTEGNFLKIGRVPVGLSAAARSTVTVKFSVVAGTAGSQDAIVPMSGTLTFTPNRRTGLTPSVLYIPVVIIGDRAVEPNETLSVTITATGAEVKRDMATVTIVNDDRLR